ncbi:hypothetical protein JXB12_01195 [candidate division KSB1 bacterium]|nr:hypothetical protein [candidate division KSB1 bacterium]
MTNPYKRHDIFKCKHESHARFDYKVSAYHVLRVKNCYPEGCLFFKWKCELLNKGKSCPRKFSHVGKKCFGCKHFYDEKINFHPQLQVSDEEFHDFLEELDEFEDWLDSIRGRHVDCWATIRAVKPRFRKIYTSKESSISLDGYILSFSDAYIGTTHWEDLCYALIYADQQERFRFSAGDEIEFFCRVGLADGRLVFNRLRSVEFLHKSHEETWTNSKSLVARGTATLFKEQPAKCLHCRSGVLVDVLDKSAPHWVRRRELYCLESMASPDLCYKVEIGQDDWVLDSDCQLSSR